MKNAAILCLVSGNCNATDLQHLADSARDRSAYLSVLVVGELPPVPVYSYGIGPYGAIDIPQHWHETLKRITDDLSETGKKLKEFLADQELEFDVRVLSSDPSALRDAISDRAMSADLVVVGEDLRENKDLFDLVVHAALFRSPAGTMINAMGQANCLRPRRVFLAWNATQQASRAARAALPMLRDAEEVSVALFDPVENLHVNHILDVSVSPAEITAPVARRAQDIVRTLLEAWEVVGSKTLYKI